MSWTSQLATHFVTVTFSNSPSERHPWLSYHWKCSYFKCLVISNKNLPAGLLPSPLLWIANWKTVFVPLSTWGPCYPENAIGWELVQALTCQNYHLVCADLIKSGFASFSPWHIPSPALTAKPATINKNMGEKLHPELEQLRVLYKWNSWNHRGIKRTCHLCFTFQTESHLYTAWWKTANYKQTTI